MFTHVRIGSNDIDRSRAFYDAALGALGLPPGEEVYGMLMYTDGANRLMIARPLEGEATFANGGTIGFVATSAGAVDAFHAGGIAAGGSSEGAPGERQGGRMYAAYLRDPDGNKICALKHSG